MKRSHFKKIALCFSLLCLTGIFNLLLTAQNVTTKPHIGGTNLYLENQKGLPPTKETRPIFAPHFIDGWMSWARELADPSIYPGFGSGSENDFIVANRFATEDLTMVNGQHLSKIGFIPTQAEGTYTAMVWVGGNATNPGTLVAEVTFNNSSLTPYEWNEVNIIPSISIDASQELWIGIHCQSPSGYPMGFDTGPQVAGKGNLYYWDNAWIQTSNPQDPTSILNDLNFCVRGYIQSTATPSVSCPASPSNVTFTSDPNFELSTSLSWTNPSVTVSGSPLSELSSIVITRNGETIHTINSPTIGANLSYIDNTVDVLGWYIYGIYATNSSGDGLHVRKNVFVGPMYLMNTTGTESISICDGYLYDDGGKYGNYSNNINSILTINPAIPENAIQIEGTYVCETNWDKLLIYDGDNIQGTLLATITGSDGGVIPQITSSQGSLTLNFTSDASLTYEGFEIRITCIDINVDCLPPIDLHANSVTNNTAYLAWLPPTSGISSSFTLEYKLVGDENYTEITNIGDLSYIIEDLTPNTEYEWRVKTICSNTSEPSGWSPLSRFKTTCDPINTPYDIDFEEYNGGDVPTCWAQFETMEASWEERFYPCVDDYQDFAHSGSRYLKFWTAEAFQTNIIALPLFEEPVSAMQITFYARYNANYPTFEVGVMEGNNFVNVQTISLTENYQQFSVDFNSYQGTGSSIAFRVNYGAVAYVFMDDISITSAVCDAPTNLTAIPYENSIDLTWDASASALSYNLYREGYLIEEGITGLSYSDENLPAGEYCYTVKSNCENGVVSNHSVETCTEITVDISEYEQLFDVYPNPANSQIIIKGKVIQQITMYNAIGQIVSNIQSTDEQVKIDVANFENGIYLINIQTVDGKMISKRVVIAD